MAIFPFYVNAQNWYEMNFNAQIKGQSVQVKFLLIQQAEDLGFIRMRYDDPVTHSDCLPEMKYFQWEFLLIALLKFPGECLIFLKKGDERTKVTFIPTLAYIDIGVVRNIGMF